MKMSEFCKIQRIQYIAKLMKKPVDRVVRYPPAHINIAHYDLRYAANVVKNKRNSASRNQTKRKTKKGKRGSLVLNYPERLIKQAMDQK